MVREVYNHTDYVAEISPSFPVDSNTTQMANTSLVTVRQAQNDATKATTHEAVTMVCVLLYTHSTTLLHHYQHMRRQNTLSLPPQHVGPMTQARSQPLTLQHYPSSTGINNVNADGSSVWTATKVANDVAERKSTEGLFSFRSSSGVLFLYNYYCWNIIFCSSIFDMLVRAHPR